MTIQRQATCVNEKLPGRKSMGFVRTWLAAGNMEVSYNRCTPRNHPVCGFSITKHPFWGTPIYGNHMKPPCKNECHPLQCPECGLFYSVARNLQATAVGFWQSSKNRDQLDQLDSRIAWIRFTCKFCQQWQWNIMELEWAPGKWLHLQGIWVAALCNGRTESRLRVSEGFPVDSMFVSII